MPYKVLNKILLPGVVLTALVFVPPAFAEKSRLGISSHFLPKKSFPLRQGRFSAIKKLAVTSNGEIIGAGFSDYDCVLVKFDKSLNALTQMVRFGSRKDSSYFSQDTITDMAIDSKGNIFVCGYTSENDFPVTLSTFTTRKNDLSDTYDDGFICKFSPDFKLLASGYIGGNYNDKALGLAIGPSDDIYVTGYTVPGGGSGKPFITTQNGFDRKLAPTYQAKGFVVRLSNDLEKLEASTFLGGNEKRHKGGDKINDITIDKDGNVWVVGQAKSGDFPATPGSSGITQLGESDAFVAKLDGNLEQMLAATYLGGRKNDNATSVIIENDGNVLVGGWTESPDLFVFIDGYDNQHSHYETDGFVAKLDPQLRKIISGTFLGGHNRKEKQEGKTKESGDDMISSMSLSADGKTLYVAGRTESKNFDTTPPSQKEHYSIMMSNSGFDRKHRVQGVLSDNGDGFVTRLTADLSTCLSSSIIGGTTLEYIDDILLHEKSAYIAGETASLDFPGIEINYSINATRGFISMLNDNPGNLSLKKPAPLKPSITAKEINTLAEKFGTRYHQQILDEEMYGELSKYARKRISRKQFDQKIARQFFLYGSPTLMAMKQKMKFRYYNYFQNDMDGYDRLELCYRVPSVGAYYGYSTFTHGRMILTLLIKNGKHHLADFEYRGFSSETSKYNMKKRLN